MNKKRRSYFMLALSIISLLSTAIGFYESAPQLLWLMGFFGGIAASQLKSKKK